MFSEQALQLRRGILLENLHHDFYLRSNWLKVKEKFKQNPKRNSLKVK